MDKPTVTFICEDCSKPFEVKQRSRRRFCDTCTTEHIQAGLAKAGRPKKEDKED